MRHGEQLAPLIDRVLREQGLVRQDLTAIAVGVGPGPFTGLRVGLVTARTLGFVLGIPVYGVCTLDVLAVEAVDTGSVTASSWSRPTPAARRSTWRRTTRTATGWTGPVVDKPAALATDGLVVGEGATLYPEHFPHACRPRAPGRRLAGPRPSPRSGPSCTTPSRSTCAAPTRSCPARASPRRDRHRRPSRPGPTTHRRSPRWRRGARPRRLVAGAGRRGRRRHAADGPLPWWCATAGEVVGVRRGERRRRRRRAAADRRRRRGRRRSGLAARCSPTSTPAPRPTAPSGCCWRCARTTRGALAFYAARLRRDRPAPRATTATAATPW